MDQENNNEQIKAVTPTNASNVKTLNVPIAILIGAVIIAGAIFFSNRGTTPSAPLAQATQNAIPIAPISVSEHILGNANAHIAVVEYSDLECPFCKQFQGVLHQLISDHNSDQQVAWVYRQFPLYKPDPNGNILHSRSGKEAEASECANELGGNTGFWNFIDGVYKTTTSNNTLNPAQLPIIATNIGLNTTAFNACLSSGKYADLIDKDYQAATAAGGQGTPFIVLVSNKKISTDTQNAVLSNVAKQLSKISNGGTLPDDFFTFDPDGTKMSWSGALPYPVLKTIVDTILSA
jgi:protein-disulfide isomerase